MYGMIAEGGAAWIELQPDGMRWVGMLMVWLSPSDPRSAKDQIEDNYSGGWVPVEGHRVGPMGEIFYKDDPPMKPVAFTKIRDEIVLVYPFSFVTIIRRDGSYDTTRLD